MLFRSEMIPSSRVFRVHKVNLQISKMHIIVTVARLGNGITGWLSQSAYHAQKEQRLKSRAPQSEQTASANWISSVQLERWVLSVNRVLLEPHVLEVMSRPFCLKAFGQMRRQGATSTRAIQNTSAWEEKT